MRQSESVTLPYYTYKTNVTERPEDDNLVIEPALQQPAIALNDPPVLVACNQEAAQSVGVTFDGNTVHLGLEDLSCHAPINYAIRYCLTNILTWHFF